MISKNKTSLGKKTYHRYDIFQKYKVPIRYYLTHILLKFGSAEIDSRHIKCWKLSTTDRKSKKKRTARFVLIEFKTFTMPKMTMLVLDKCMVFGLVRIITSFFFNFVSHIHFGTFQNAQFMRKTKPTILSTYTGITGMLVIFLSVQFAFRSVQLKKKQEKNVKSA